MKRLPNESTQQGYGAIEGAKKNALPLTRLSAGLICASLAGLLLLGAVSAGCSTSPDRDEIALNLYKQNSKSYYNSGKYRETIDQCQKGLAIDEDDFSLNLTMSWALLKTGGKADLFAAYDQFQKTLDLLWFDTDFRALLGLGQTCYKIAIIYHTKLEQLNKRVEAEPESRELFEDEIEECEEGKERYLREAIEYLNRTLEEERQKENIEAILTLGQAYAYWGRFTESEAYLTRGLKLLEDSTSFQQSKLDKDQSITSDGRRFFERQIARNLIWEKELRGVLAYVYARHKEFDKALEQYDLLEQRDLFDDFQYYNRGITLQKLGRYEDSIRDFEKFLSNASVAGKQFDEDEHFHLAFEKIAECRAKLGLN